MMSTSDRFRGCAGCAFSRRRFLAGCVAGAGTVALGGVRPCAAAEPGPVQPGGAKPRVRIVYALHAVKQPGPDWPNVGYDFAPVMERINEELSRRCPDIEFLPTLAKGPAEAQKIVEDDKAAPVDGYLVYQMNCWNQVVQTLAKTGKPVVYADYQYAGSGGFLVYTAALLRAKADNVGFVASSRLEDVAAAVGCIALVKKGGALSDFVAATAKLRQERTPKAGDLACKEDVLPMLSPQECMGRLKESRILAVTNHKQTGPAGDVMGIPLINVGFEEVNAAWKAADPAEARLVADRWERAASEVTGVQRETLEQSAAMYLAMKAVLRKHRANAITINCLGGFYGKHIHAYPCLGFHELCNEGLVGACECDVRSTATMVAGMVLTQGRPGYISDPVIDTAKRQIIYAHCVASNRVFGPRGPANPFAILTHSEDRQGASVRSVLPLGFMTTTLEILPARKEILFHQAKAVANDTDDRACRTKLAGEPVGDIEKLFAEWDRWGWHRVTFYGDLKAGVAALADGLGWKVVEEA